MKEIPIIPNADQQLIITLNDTDYVLNIRYNERAGTWKMDMYEAVSGNPVLIGLSLVLGCDLLLPYNLGIGALFLFDNSNKSRDAAEDDLGNRVKLIWMDEVEAYG